MGDGDLPWNAKPYHRRDLEHFGGGVNALKTPPDYSCLLTGRLPITKFRFSNFVLVLCFGNAHSSNPFPRTKMLYQKLQSVLLPSLLVALALIGLGLLRRELRTPGIGLVRKKKARLLKFFKSKDSDKDQSRKAS